EKVLQPLGIIPPHMGVISILRSDGPLTQRQLGHLMKVDPTSMVWLIDALEKKRLVRREAHPHDRRAYHVKLTAAGEALYHRAAKQLEKMEAEFLSPLTQAEQEQLKRLLTRLFESIQPHGIPRDLFKES